MRDPRARAPAALAHDGALGPAAAGAGPAAAGRRRCTCWWASATVTVPPAQAAARRARCVPARRCTALPGARPPGARGGAGRRGFVPAGSGFPGTAAAEQIRGALRV
ncbi:MAG: hypothetical protein MZW92_22265 [Comamonadaceae bacterium]|nr:hypothetical protein [Comamonadaceae bacterium]